MHGQSVYRVNDRIRDDSQQEIGISHSLWSHTSRARKPFENPLMELFALPLPPPYSLNKTQIDMAVNTETRTKWQGERDAERR